MEYKNIIVTHTGSTCMIQINRPEADNKLSNECMEEIICTIKTAESSGKCRAVILTGLEEWFCAGGDIGNYWEKSILDIKAFGKAFIELHLTIYNSPLPIIAAVKGRAYGGGCSLVEVCDLAVASESAVFAVPEMKSGLAPAMGFSGLYSNLPKKKAMALGLLGEELNAWQAKELGLINEVVPDSKLMDAALEMASEFEGFDPVAVRLFKEMYVDMGAREYENRLKIGQSAMISLFKAKGEE